MSTVLSRHQVQEIARKYQDGSTLRELAEQYKVSHMTVRRRLKAFGVKLRRGGRRVLYVTERRCLICRQIKPIEKFTKNSQRPIGYDYVCKECHRKKAKKKNIETNFGITLADFHKMEQAQGGGCAICSQKERRKRRGTAVRLAVDHDHESGAIRGLLCTRCNTAIGLLEENPYLLKRAIEYLNKRSRDSSQD